MANRNDGSTVETAPAGARLGAAGVVAAGARNPFAAVAPATGRHGTTLAAGLVLAAAAVAAVAVLGAVDDRGQWLVGLGGGLVLLALAVLLDAVLVLRGRRPLELALACLRVAVDDLAATNDALGRANRAWQETAADRERALAQLEAVSRERQAFLESVAHDLRTPLTVIKGHADLLLQRAISSGDPQIAHTAAGLTSIVAGAAQMTGLIDDLLDWVTLGTAQPAGLDLGSVDLVALAEKAARKHSRLGSPRVRIEATEPTLVGEWDAGRLERVLDNLLSNAIKYSPGRTEVRLGVARADGLAVVTVQDDGIGIPAADLPRIFEPYFRGGNATDRVPGTGLGLVGVRRTVEAHGGTVAVASREGHGSTFTVRLPPRVPTPAARERSDDRVESSPTGLARGSAAATNHAPPG
jgi:signal transduction histidine kinase